MGYFKLLSRTNLKDIKLDQRIEESDFSLQQGDDFLQFEYVEEERKLEPYPVKPGVFSINKTMMGLELMPTTFTQDKILKDLLTTKSITEKIDMFFNRLNVYYEEGIEIPKRGALLFGPAGTGKSSGISAIVEKYAGDEKTLIVTWSTDTFEASDVKRFFKSFEYKGVERMILIAEDIGGIENDAATIRSDSSLLSLLDNKEKTFRTPTYIIATTNYAQNLMGNLTNRPDRFDDKLEIGYPTATARVELLKFYLKDAVTPDSIKLIESKKCEEFTPAHIREIRIRSKIHDKTPEAVIKEIQAEIESYKKAFSKQQAVGFGIN